MNTNIKSTPSNSYQLDGGISQKFQYVTKGINSVKRANKEPSHTNLFSLISFNSRS